MASASSTQPASSTNARCPLRVRVGVDGVSSHAHRPVADGSTSCCRVLSRAPPRPRSRSSTCRALPLPTNRSCCSAHSLPSGFVSTTYSVARDVWDVCQHLRFFLGGRARRQLDLTDCVLSARGMRDLVSSCSFLEVPKKCVCRVCRVSCVSCVVSRIDDSENCRASKPLAPPSWLTCCREHPALRVSCLYRVSHRSASTKASLGTHSSGSSGSIARVIQQTPHSSNLPTPALTTGLFPGNARTWSGSPDSSCRPATGPARASCASAYG